MMYACPCGNDFTRNSTCSPSREFFCSFRRKIMKTNIFLVAAYLLQSSNALPMITFGSEHEYLTDQQPRLQWNPQSVPAASILKPLKSIKTATEEEAPDYFDFPMVSALKRKRNPLPMTAEEIQLNFEDAMNPKQDEIFNDQNYKAYEAQVAISNLMKHLPYTDTIEIAQQFADKAIEKNQVSILIHLLQEGAILRPDQMEWARGKFDIKKALGISSITGTNEGLALDIHPVEIVRAAYEKYADDYHNMNEVHKLLQDRPMDEDSQAILADLRAKNKLLLNSKFLAQYFENIMRVPVRYRGKWKETAKEMLESYLEQGQSIHDILTSFTNWEAKGEMIDVLFDSFDLTNEQFTQLADHLGSLDVLMTSNANFSGRVISYIINVLVRRKISTPREIYELMVSKNKYLAGYYDKTIIKALGASITESDLEDLQEAKKKATEI